MLHVLHSAPKEKSENTPILVMLHGRGSDEHDLFGLKNAFDSHLETYSLRAPFTFAWGGFTWFELSDNGSVDLETFQQSKNAILEFFSTLNSKNIILFGFSMGAIMSYALSLAQPNLCKGIACLSGFAPAELEQDYQLNALQNLHIFISHGILDPVIPIAMPRKTKEILSRSNAIVSYNEYNMGHEINEECLVDVKAWLAALI